MKGLISLFAGFGVGVLIVLGIVLLLAITSRLASADGTLRINELKEPIEVEFRGQSDAITDLLIIHMTPDSVPVFKHVDGSTVKEWCGDSNRYLKALKANLDAESRKNPHLAELYAPGYESIERAWCK